MTRVMRCVYIQERKLVREAVDVIDTCEQECDGVIFTGSGICDYVLGHHQMQKPYTYIRRSASSIAEVFLKMVREGREIDTFSIDVVEKQIIEDILDAFHIQPRNIYIPARCLQAWRRKSMLHGIWSCWRRR